MGRTEVRPHIQKKRGLGALDGAEDGLDVDDGGAVDSFDGADAQAVSGDFAHGDGMKAEGIGPVRRARGENTG